MSNCGHNVCMQRGQGCNLEGRQGDLLMARSARLVTVEYECKLLESERDALKAEMEDFKKLFRGRKWFCDDCYWRTLAKGLAEAARFAKRAYEWPLEKPTARACGQGCDMSAAGPGKDREHDPECHFPALAKALAAYDATVQGEGKA